MEAQTFSLQDPGLFFSLYSPPQSDGSFRLARTRLEEDLKFVSKMVRAGVGDTTKVSLFPPRFPMCVSP